jgi:hypothetical protein
MYRGAVVASAVFLSACGSTTPVDLVEECPTTTVRLPPPPFGPAIVRISLDARPVSEHGRDRYLGERRVGDQEFRAPVAEALLIVAARDLRASGLFSSASLRGDAPYRFDIEIRHAYAAYGSALSDVVPIFPSGLEAVADLRVVFGDVDGRVFMDERFVERRDGSSVALEGRSDRAGALLGAALRAALDRSFLKARESYDVFWSRFPVESRPRR